MALNLISGKLGTGKTKLAVRIAREYLERGRKVVTNLDVRLEELLPASSRSTLVRIPDKPKAADLESAGHGNPDSYDEDFNGAIILDELGSWLNARTFQDKDRMPVIDWLLHSRKHGYDCFFICQDLQQIDKQVRESLVEYVIRCIRFDKMKLPLVGGLLNALFGGKVGYLPRMHVATKRLGVDPAGLIGDRWWYRGDELHKAYDTRQVFRTDYEHGPHSLLSAWHVRGRHLAPRAPWWVRLRTWFDAPAPRPASLRPKLPAIEAIMLSVPPEQRIAHIRRLDWSK